MSRQVFRYKSAQATVKVESGSLAQITNLYANVPRQGHATEVLNQITAFADEFAVELWLSAQRYGKPQHGMDNAALVRFYRKFGFIQRDNLLPVQMFRTPVFASFTRPIIED